MKIPGDVTLFLGSMYVIKSSSHMVPTIIMYYRTRFGGDGLAVAKIGTNHHYRYITL